MKVLGIETTCDETAAAVVELTKGNFKSLSNIVSSQIELHQRFGGVVPEIAARSHLEVILPVIEQSLEQAKVEWPKIDGIAVSYGPGLPGALLVGVATAKALALSKQKPLTAVDHVKAHMYAAWLENNNQKTMNNKQPQFPLLGLIVSGGHTQLVLFSSHERYRLLGQTLDDAAGEAFDKVAKMLGLGLPGGPAVAKAAVSSKATRYHFPIPKLEGAYDFSFSGLKTAVLRHLQKLIGEGYDFPSHKLAPLLKPAQIADTAAAFQSTAVNILVSKLASAVREFKPQGIVVAGGVAANTLLRRQLDKQLPQIIYPPLELCTDNAAMVAALGVVQLRTSQTINPLRLETAPSLSM